MSRRSILAAYKLFFAVLVFIAILVQFINGLLHNGLVPVNFFSFFTIDSNVFAAVVFVLSGVAYLQGRQTQSIIGLRGAALIYMTVTGVIYALLLAGLEQSLQTTIPWVNFILHYMFPVVVIADWFIDSPGERIDYRTALLWLIFPIVWLIYTLIRGPFAHWYPYPFLNPANGGYGQVAITSLFITLFFCLLCVVAVLTSRVGSRSAANQVIKS
jgi:hypothetical protein